MLISRDEARSIALAHLRDQLGAPSSSIGESTNRRPTLEIGSVLLAEEIQSRPPLIYGLREPLENCWVAYVHRPLMGLRPSEIVIISRNTGDVVYSGSAGDEG
jgi:hypothetical protein